LRKKDDTNLSLEKDKKSLWGTKREEGKKGLEASGC